MSRPDRVGVYLDHNATTPIASEVLDAMLPYLREQFGNPSSDHALGRRAHEAAETARAQVAELIGAAPAEIVFTSGGTESNNLAVRGVAASAATDRRRIVTSVVEHPAIVGPCAILESEGWTIARVPVTSEGVVDARVAMMALGPDVALLTLMRAQNETGALMPVGDVAAAARSAGVIVHSDAAQAVGKVEVDVDDLGVDLLSIAGHKLYAPKGVGALYVRAGTPIAPITFGGGQERGLRPGTENVAGIVALGAAAARAQDGLAEEAVRQRALRDALWEKLSSRIPGLVRHTPFGPSLPNTLALSFPGVLGKDVLAAADGVFASTGSACHAGVDSPAETLLAMGVPPGIALGSVRLSLGRSTTADDLAIAVDSLAVAYKSVSSR